jgi:hypothetical protein
MSIRHNQENGWVRTLPARSIAALGGLDERQRNRNYGHGVSAFSDSVVLRGANTLSYGLKTCRKETPMRKTQIAPPSILKDHRP